MASDDENPFRRSLNKPAGNAGGKRVPGTKIAAESAGGPSRGGGVLPSDESDWRGMVRDSLQPVRKHSFWRTLVVELCKDVAETFRTAIKLIAIIVVAIVLHHVCDFLVDKHQIIAVTIAQLRAADSFWDVLEILSNGVIFIGFRAAEVGVYFMDLYFFFRKIWRSGRGQ